jgi:hypothetical protein
MLLPKHEKDCRRHQVAYNLQKIVETTKRAAHKPQLEKYIREQDYKTNKNKTE